MQGEGFKGGGGLEEKQGRAIDNMKLHVFSLLFPYQHINRYSCILS